jgi:hypothetical protein
MMDTGNLYPGRFGDLADPFYLSNPFFGEASVRIYLLGQTLSVLYEKNGHNPIPLFIYSL